MEIVSTLLLQTARSGARRRRSWAGFYSQGVTIFQNFQEYMRLPICPGCMLVRTYYITPQRMPHGMQKYGMGCKNTECVSQMARGCKKQTKEQRRGAWTQLRSSDRRQRATVCAGGSRSHGMSQVQAKSEGSQTSRVAASPAAAGCAATGNCNTVADWPAQRRVSSTTCPSGNSSAS